MDLTTQLGGLILPAAAFLFAVVSGVNDGATLLALGVRVSSIPLLVPTLIVAGSVVVAPLIIGTRVASTLLEGLASFDGALATSTFVAVTGSLVTITFLGWQGLPTSLTVALLGGLVGAAVGQGVAVHWGTVITVVVIALVTPGIGLVVTFWITRLALRVDVRGRASSFLARGHLTVFTIQCLAYGANDGQKMLAVSFVAAGGVAMSSPAIPLRSLVLMAAFFALGTLIGLRRYARSVALDVFPVGPAGAVAAELGSAVSVLGTGLLGNPVSMTQTVVTSVIGAGIHEGARRVRWENATRVGLAWVYTFPLTFALGWVLGLVIGSAS